MFLLSCLLVATLNGVYHMWTKQNMAIGFLIAVPVLALVGVVLLALNEEAVNRKPRLIQMALLNVADEYSLDAIAYLLHLPRSGYYSDFKLSRAMNVRVSELLDAHAPMQPDVAEYFRKRARSMKELGTFSEEQKLFMEAVERRDA